MEEHTHQQPKVPNKFMSALQANSIPLSIVIAGLFIAGAVLINARTAQTAQKAEVAGAQPSAQNAAAAKPANIDEIKTAGLPFIGNPNAPVVIAYWYDYQCPFCKQAETNIFPQLITDYVNTGKVKVVFKDFPVLGSDSQSAALAESGIWESAPAKFEEWHQQMYEHQDAENSGWGNRKDIVALMKSIGIDGDKVDALIVSKSADYQKAIQSDMDEAQTYGVTGTPSFMIGKKLIVGSVPYAQIKSAVDDVLASK